MPRACATSGPKSAGCGGGPVRASCLSVRTMPDRCGREACCNCVDSCAFVQDRAAETGKARTVGHVAAASNVWGAFALLQRKIRGAQSITRKTFDRDYTPFRWVRSMRAPALSVLRKEKCPNMCPGIFLFLVGRAGFEPATNGLKVQKHRQAWTTLDCHQSHKPLILLDT